MTSVFRGRDAHTQGKSHVKTEVGPGVTGACQGAPRLVRSEATGNWRRQGRLLRRASRGSYLHPVLPMGWAMGQSPKMAPEPGPHMGPSCTEPAGDQNVTEVCHFQVWLVRGCQLHLLPSWILHFGELGTTIWKVQEDNLERQTVGAEGNPAVPGSTSPTCT